MPGRRHADLRACRVRGRPSAFTGSSLNGFSSRERTGWQGWRGPGLAGVDPCTGTCNRGWRARPSSKKGRRRRNLRYRRPYRVTAAPPALGAPAVAGRPPARSSPRGKTVGRRRLRNPHWRASGAAGVSGRRPACRPDPNRCIGLRSSCPGLRLRGGPPCFRLTAATDRSLTDS